MGTAIVGAISALGTSAFNFFGAKENRQAANEYANNPFNQRTQSEKTNNQILAGAIIIIVIIIIVLALKNRK